MQPIGNSKEFLSNKEVITQLLTPAMVDYWIHLYGDRIKKPMLDDPQQRCVVLLYGSSASLGRNLQASQKLIDGVSVTDVKMSSLTYADHPVDILHMDLKTALRKFPDKPEIQACVDDLTHQSYVVITGTYLPLKMLGNDEDGMYPFAVTTHVILNSKLDI